MWKRLGVHIFRDGNGLAGMPFKRGRRSVAAHWPRGRAPGLLRVTPHGARLFSRTEYRALQTQVYGPLTMASFFSGDDIYARTVGRSQLRPAVARPPRVADFALVACDEAVLSLRPEMVVNGHSCGRPGVIRQPIGVANRWSCYLPNGARPSTAPAAGDSRTPIDRARQRHFFALSDSGPAGSS
jgi:hypothetical protein